MKSKLRQLSVIIPLVVFFTGCDAETSHSVKPSEETLTIQGIWNETGFGDIYTNLSKNMI